MNLIRPNKTNAHPPKYRLWGKSCCKFWKYCSQNLWDGDRKCTVATESVSLLGVFLNLHSSRLTSWKYAKLDICRMYEQNYFNTEELEKVMFLRASSVMRSIVFSWVLSRFLDVYWSEIISSRGASHTEKKIDINFHLYNSLIEANSNKVKGLITQVTFIQNSLLHVP